MRDTFDNRICKCTVRVFDLVRNATVLQRTSTSSNPGHVWIHGWLALSGAIHNDVAVALRGHPHSNPLSGPADDDTSAVTTIVSGGTDGVVTVDSTDDDDVTTIANLNHRTPPSALLPDPDDEGFSLSVTSPGSTVLLHHRLSSPSRKRSCAENTRISVARQARATETRARMQQEMTERLRKHNTSKIEAARERREVQFPLRGPCLRSFSLSGVFSSISLTGPGKPLESRDYLLMVLFRPTALCHMLSNYFAFASIVFHSTRVRWVALGVKNRTLPCVCE